MPLATRNGSIIVKDGKLAENCDCCGGWYCCALDACAIADSVSVTIEASCGGDLVGSSKQLTPWGTADVLYQGARGPGYYRYRQTIVPVSSLNGTHQLAREPENPTNPFVAVFSQGVADAAGGTTFLRAEIGVSGLGNASLVLSVKYPNYAWSKNTLDDSLPFKALSEMPSATVCDRLEHSPNPVQGEWECYNLDSNIMAASWDFGCEIDAMLSANRQILSVQRFYTGVNLSWSCPYPLGCTLKVQVQ